jgi:hypothetical protein
MPRCRSCDYPLLDDLEKVGARCPSCRDPLYEPPTRIARPVRAGEAACGVHPANESIGTCARCGNFYCETCRCRWRNQLLCAACVRRALSGTEGTPEQANSHFRQAFFALILSLAAWALLALVILISVLVKPADPQANLGMGLLVLFIVPISSVANVFAIGLGAAAIRVGGNHQILALSGLILSCLCATVQIGNISWGIWHW